MTVVLETARVQLRHFTPDDAPFVLALLNDPDFVRFIGDRGLRTADDARRYVEDRLMASYAAHGFGLWLAQRKDDGTPIGMCGLVKRDTLDDVDVGFALLPEYRSRGYVHESAAAVLTFARDCLALTRIVAIVNPINADSIRVLERLGLTHDRPIRLQNDSPELLLYSRALD